MLKRRLFISWLIGAGLMAGVFYAAVAWLWSAVSESRAASIEAQVVSALSNDLAEGNLFKLGATLSKLKRDGLLRFAEIRQIGYDKKSSFVFRTPGGGDPAEDIFAGFSCGEQRRLVTRPKNGVSLITTLPSNNIGMACSALFITSDLPPELTRIKRRIIASFGGLLVVLFCSFFWLTMSWYRKILNLETANILLRGEKDAEMGRIAAQVAHDIRSPLVALDAALKNTAELPEKKRIIVRHAVNRIRDIANNLLEKNRQHPKAASAADNAAGGRAGEPLEVRLLSSLIDPVITEKRLQFESKPGVNLDFELTRESYGLFAKIQPVEFRRMVSNLVNNAVEVLGDKGVVNVGLTHDDENIILTVADNGKGIPPAILAKLGQRGETHGKAGGSGLGLFHARSTAESWGGSLVITSELGKGTAVTIKLPKAEAPAGFVPALVLPPGQPVVVLDDDETIHQVWEGRFDSARVKEHDIEIIHFSEPDKLREWVKADPAKAKTAVCLFDYELLGFKETGLSLAEELDLCNKTILVTSRGEEQRIIEDCTRLNIRMIPKGLADFVPITIAAPVPALAVLIDDDAMVHMNWETAAEEVGVELKAFRTPAEFLANLAAFPKNTPIYIDSELEAEIKGEDIAADLKEKGFTNLRLATGHPPEKFSHLPWLKVIGKESPWRA